MTVSWLRIGLMLIAAIVVHDAYMAASGYDMALAAPVSACEPIVEPHRHHHHGDRQDIEPTNPAPTELPEGCDPLREAVSLNREMRSALADIPATLPSDSTILMLFAATSRTVMESPPPHPPDLNRAFFQVYRI